MSICNSKSVHKQCVALVHGNLPSHCFRISISLKFLNLLNSIYNYLKKSIDLENNTIAITNSSRKFKVQDCCCDVLVEHLMLHIHLLGLPVLPRQPRELEQQLLLLGGWLQLAPEDLASLGLHLLGRVDIHLDYCGLPEKQNNYLVSIFGTLTNLEKKSINLSGPATWGGLITVI